MTVQTEKTISREELLSKLREIQPSLDKFGIDGVKIATTCEEVIDLMGKKLSAAEIAIALKFLHSSFIAAAVKHLEEHLGRKEA